MTDEPTKPYDPNESATVKMFPSAAGLVESGLAGIKGETLSAEMYAQIFERVSKQIDPQDDAAAKAIAPPPTAFTFGRISYMPEAYNSGVLQWPGIAPEALAKVVRENLAPQMIIGERCNDVLRYSQLSSQIWRPGWKIEPIVTTEHPSESDLKDIREAELYIANCGTGITQSQARERDAQAQSDFQRFLDALVRDTLTFGAIAVWTDMDNADKVRAFGLMPAGNIRLVGPAGYLNNPEIFAVAIDDGAKVIAEYSRRDLVFYTRNSRVDPVSFGYPLAEIEIAVRLISGFQNAMDLNFSVFDRNSTPHGILVLSGSSVTQRQLDLLNRMWTNLKKGITKAWALPVIGLADGSKLEVVDLSRIHGMEGYYKDFMNMMMGAFATIYRFPVHRLGYRISGHGKDTEQPANGGGELVDEDDNGLAPLLIHIENVINQYILWTRWPHLRFTFTGKNPKESAREFQLKRDAMTFGEARAMSHLKALEEMVEGEDLKELAKILSMAPLDPNMSGAFQSIMSVYLSSKFGVTEDPGKQGNRMENKRDPAATEEHGGTAGVRRNSKLEASRSKP